MRWVHPLKRRHRCHQRRPIALNSERFKKNHMNHAAFSNRGLKQALIIINNVNEKSKVKINYLKLCVDVSACFFFCTISFLRFKMVHRFNINGNNAKVLNRQTIALWNSYAIAHGSHFRRFCSLSLVLDMHFSSFKRFFYSIASISFLCGYFFWIVHFYLRGKKTVAILTFEFFVFVIRFAWKVWWLVTNHIRNVYIPEKSKFTEN